MIRCIAVDDEPLALEQIAKYIRQVPELELVGKALSPRMAFDMILKEKPNLVFLDIEMPGSDGISLARSLSKQLKDETPFFIFTTAFSQYAVEGFRVDAVDYLLKPIGMADFTRAVDRVHRRMRSSLNPTGDPEFEPLTVRADGRQHVIPLEEILYIRGCAEYVQIFRRNNQKSIITLYSMKRLEALLPPSRFARVQKSFIISLPDIEAYDDTHVIVNREKIPIGDFYRKEFMRRFCAMTK